LPAAKCGVVCIISARPSETASNAAKAGTSSPAAKTRTFRRPPDIPFFKHLSVKRSETAPAKGVRLPAIYPDRVFANAGGMIFYGPDITDNFRRAADYVDRILKGAKPGDLPVQRPTKFELIINAALAKAIGVTIPTTLLLRADEVIE
jgi:hypothetical protein